MKWIIFLILPCTLVLAADSKETTKGFMHEFMRRVSTLKSLAVSPQDFNDPANAPVIDENLQGLTDAVSAAKHDDKLKKPGFKFRRQALEEHFKNTERLFKSGNKTAARQFLNSGLMICATCHAQVPGESRSAWAFNEPEKFTNLFDEAEFMFATRDFESAVALFEKFLEKNISDSKLDTQIRIAIQRIVAFHARVKRDPKRGLENLLAIQKLKGTQASVAKSLESWIDAFKRWKSTPPPQVEKLKDKDIEKFVKARLLERPKDRVLIADERESVDYLFVSGVLYQYIEKNPESKILPQILFWLSLCERGISQEYFLSLADVYLKQCVYTAGPSEIGQKCFNDYKQYLYELYTNKNATEVPASVKGEVELLEKVLKK